MQEILKPRIKGKTGIGWDKTSRHGENYIAIKVSVPVGEEGGERQSHTLVIFKNKQKGGKNNYDYVVYPSRKRFIKVDDGSVLGDGDKPDDDLNKSMYAD